MRGTQRTNQDRDGSTKRDWKFPFLWRGFHDFALFEKAEILPDTSLVLGVVESELPPMTEAFPT
jgi:hypothetical protein